MFLDEFCLKHPKELKTLELGNLFRSENKNILEHSLMAGALAQLLCDLLRVEGEEKEAVVSAAIIHDWDVLDEKAHFADVARKKMPQFSDFSAYQKKVATRLRIMGYSDRVIELTEANVTREPGGPKTLPEMIVFYSDAILLGAKIVDIKMRFKLTRQGWHSGKGTFDPVLAEQNRIYSEQFFVGAPGHENSRSHFDVQEESGDNISHAFLEILTKKDPDILNQHPYLRNDPNKLPYYLEEKLEAKIMNAEKEHRSKLLVKTRKKKGEDKI